MWLRVFSLIARINLLWDPKILILLMKALVDTRLKLIPHIIYFNEFIEVQLMGLFGDGPPHALRFFIIPFI